MKFIKQLFCEHEWTKAKSYVDLYYDVCKKCDKRRLTNEENVDYSQIKLPKIIIKSKALKE